MASPPIKMIHKNDIEWIIQLWHAIHGGDPAPEKLGTISERSVHNAAMQTIRALAPHLGAEKAKAVINALGH